MIPGGFARGISYRLPHRINRSIYSEPRRPVKSPPRVWLGSSFVIAALRRSDAAAGEWREFKREA